MEYRQFFEIRHKDIESYLAQLVALNMNIIILMKTNTNTGNLSPKLTQASRHKNQGN